MIDNLQHSSSEKLIALLDGELNREEAGTLYYELASNQELQDEMHQLISMKKLVAMDNAAPPSHLKSGILLATGFASDAEILHAESETSGASAGLYKTLTGKPFLMTLSALVAFFMSAAYFTTQKAITSDIADNSTSKAIPVVYSYDYQYPPIEAESSLANYVASSERRISSYDDVRQLNEDGAEAEEFVTNYTSIIEENDVRNEFAQLINPAQPLNIRYASLPIPEKFRPNVNPLRAASEAKPFDNKLSLSLRGLTAKSFPELDVKPLTDPMLKNYVLNLSWNFSKNHALGIELGQEDFYQKYTSSELGNHYEILQNWRAFIIGMAYQYTLEAIQVPIMGDVNPYFKLFAGGTTVGSLLKGGTGFQYFVNEKLAFFAGLEASWLRYTHQDNSYNTNKLGLVYGVNVLF